MDVFHLVTYPTLHHEHATREMHKCVGTRSRLLRDGRCLPPIKKNRISMEPFAKKGGEIGSDLF
jgi:hypothetical protein